MPPLKSVVKKGGVLRGAKTLSADVVKRGAKSHKSFRDDPRPLQETNLPASTATTLRGGPNTADRTAVVEPEMKIREYNLRVFA